MVLFYPGSVWRNGCALYSNAILFRRHCGFHSHPVIGTVTVLKAQIIVFGFQIHIGEDQDILDHFPEDPGHFVAVHFYKGRLHGNLLIFSHNYLSSL